MHAQVPGASPAAGLQVKPDQRAQRSARRTAGVMRDALGPSTSSSVRLQVEQRTGRARRVSKPQSWGRAGARSAAAHASRRAPLQPTAPSVRAETGCRAACLPPLRPILIRPC